MDEEWKPIIGYEESYEVSNHGRVRSITRTICWGPANVCRDFESIVMRDYPHWKGHRVIFLRKQGEGKKKFFVHRLVAVAFIPNPNNLPLVNHKDLNKANNHISNLEWATVSENTQHYYDNRAKATDDASDIPF